MPHHQHDIDCADSGCAGPTRRHLIGGIAALGGSYALAGTALSAEPAANPRRIDVHHHIYPPAWQKLMQEQGQTPLPIEGAWSPEQVLQHMDKTGVAAGLASAAMWRVKPDPARLADMARGCNYAAQMIHDHPGRFGVFAALPLPDVEASLKEIGYALDTLKADGIGMITSYGDKWPGDPLFRPVFEELDRRKAVVYFHPTSPDCCGNLLPQAPAGPATIEWPFDTARAILSLLTSGSLVRYPNVRLIFSHAGGALPALSGRIAGFLKLDKRAAEYAPQGAMAELNKLYYDTANATAAPSMAALMAMAPISQIVFGTDYPYFSLEENVAGLDKIKLTPDERAAVNRGNVARLLPKYAA